MTIITILLSILALLNAFVTIVGTIYAFATIRGTTVAFWMGGQILFVLLTLASPFMLVLSQNYFGANIQTAVLSQNLILGLVSLVVSILFILVVARIERLKKSNARSSDLFQ